MTDTEWLQYNTLIAATKLASIDQMTYFITRAPRGITARVLSIVEQLNTIHVDLKRELDKEAARA